LGSEPPPGEFDGRVLVLGTRREHRVSDRLGRAAVVIQPPRVIDEARIQRLKGPLLLVCRRWRGRCLRTTAEQKP
jgi:hypothetical protein